MEWNLLFLQRLWL